MTNNSNHNPPAITKIIACEVVLEEMLPIMPADTKYAVLKYGLHARPDDLRKELQLAIDVEDETPGGSILLAYGLCSRAVVGLKSRISHLIVPRLDDCIGLFLGSRQAYLDQIRIEPGSYYMTKGWVEAEEGPDSGYSQMVNKYGPEKAIRLQKVMLNNYKRVLYINTGQYETAEWKARARALADKYGLRYEETDGTDRMIRQMIEGPWDKEFVIVPPAQEIAYESFYLSPEWQRAS